MIQSAPFDDSDAEGSPSSEEDDAKIQAQKRKSLPVSTLNRHSSVKSFDKVRQRLLRSGFATMIQGITSQARARQQNVCPEKLRLLEKYNVGEKIGEGTQAVVKSCFLRGDQLSQFVVKVMDISDIEMLFMRLEEQEIHRVLDHPTIVKVLDFYVSKIEKKLYQIQERAPGSTLMHMLAKKGKFSELECFFIMKQLLQGVDYLHGRQICHRDLTLDNLIYESRNRSLKIIDFSISKKLIEQKMWTRTGKLQYMAPELFSQNYDKSVDLWAIGVLFYSLLQGHMLFQADSIGEQELIANIKHMVLDFSSLMLSDSCKKLLSGLLERDPKIRLTARQALQHPWMRQMEQECLLQQRAIKKLKHRMSVDLQQMADSPDFSPIRMHSYKQNGETTKPFLLNRSSLILSGSANF